MGPNGDLLGYDAYWNPDNMYDGTDHQRLLQSGLSLFLNGRLVLSEWGHICSGAPCQIDSGSRTASYEGYGVLGEWQDARGLLLFAYNATGKPNGCFAVYNSSSGFCPGGVAELQMLGDQMRSIIKPVQTSWFDGAESKAAGWSLGGWTIDTAAPYQGVYRFRCLPSSNATMTSPLFSAVGSTLVTLRYAYKHQLPSGSFLYVEMSGDNGATWTTLAQHTGTATSGTEWLTASIGVPEKLAGKSQCRVRFRYTTISSSTLFGAAIDNIQVVTK